MIDCLIDSWTLTIVWYTEMGLPKQGILQLCYYSGEDIMMNECRIDPNIRRMLLLLVLLDPTDIDLDVKSLTDSSDGRFRQYRHFYDRNIRAVTESTSIVTHELRDQVTTSLLPITNKKYILEDITNNLNSNTGLKWTYFTVHQADSWKKYLDVI